MPNLVVSSHSHCLFTHLSFCPEMRTPSSPKRRGGSSFSPTLLVPPRAHHHLFHCPQMTPILPLRPIVTDRRPVSSALALMMSGAQTNRTGSFRLLSSSKHEIGSSNKEEQIRTRLISHQFLESSQNMCFSSSEVLTELCLLLSCQRTKQGFLHTLHC